MRKIFTTIALLVGLLAQAQTGAYNEQALAYIRQFRELAMEEQRRSGVPAAITLAQGIHETQAGQSELATEANNHFGIKCKKEWTGETYAHTDDAPNECFRKYAQATDSYRDHSDYLKNSKRYQSCFMLDPTNYSGWANELKKCGYATNPRYAQKLIHIVEDFHLQDYTLAALNPQRNNEPILVASAGKTTNAPIAGEVVPDQETIAQPKDVEIIEPAAEPVAVEEAPPAVEPPLEETIPVYGQQTMRNNLKGFYAHKGDVLLEPAIKYNMRYARMLELNDLPDAPLEADMFVYTEKKRAAGLRSKHTVKEGETMVQIAQIEGIQLKQLRTLNQMDIDEEPIAGNALNLRVMTASRPPVRKRGAAQPAYTTQNYHQNNVAAPAVAAEAIPLNTEQPIAMNPASPAAVVEEEEEEVMEAVVPQKDAKAEQQILPTEVKNTVQVLQPTEAVMPVIAEQAAEPQPQPVQEIVIATPVPEQQPVKREPTPAPRPRPSAPPKQKTYTIADEPAVGEEEPKVYSPRYKPTEQATEIKGIDPNLAPKLAPNKPSVSPQFFDAPAQAPAQQVLQAQPVQAAQTPAIVTEMVKEEPVKEEEPQDEFSRLKRQLDKAVYGTKTTKSSGMTVVEERPAPGREVAPVHPSAIPVTKQSVPATAPAATGEGTYHIVKTGETAFSIAKQYGLSMKQLMAMNNLNFEAIKIGQKLRVK